MGTATLADVPVGQFGEDSPSHFGVCFSSVKRSEDAALQALIHARNAEPPGRREELGAGQSQSVPEKLVKLHDILLGSLMLSAGG